MSWQAVTDEWSEKLSYLKSTGYFSDVTLVVGNDDKTRKFKLHRTILAMHSEVMEELLYASNSEVEIRLVDDPRCFELMLRFIYCQDVVFLVIEEAIGTYRLAEKYIIFPLKDKCLCHLRKNLLPENVLQVYQFATEIDDSNLQMESWRYIAQNTTKVLSSPSLPKMNESLLLRVVTEPILTVGSEVEIYKAVSSWGRAECERTARSITTENLRAILVNCLPHIRFLTFTVDEFQAELVESNVLEESEKLNILLNIVKPGAMPLPRNWTPSKEKRILFPTDKKWFSYQRKGEKRLSQITGFPRIVESFQLSQDTYIFGVGFYLSLSNEKILLPEVGYVTLSIRKEIDPETFEEKFSIGSLTLTNEVELILGRPIYVRRSEVCEVSLKENFDSMYTFFYCSADCVKHSFPFASKQKYRKYHFHKILAVPM